jgi:hypothetical protein
MKKKFDSVKMQRDIRDKLSKQMEGMTDEEVLAFIKKGSEEYRKYIRDRKARSTTQK